MVQLLKFRKKNGLTQTQVGDYLECKKSFISFAERGIAKFPKEKLIKLLDNPYGWDTSMLDEEECSDAQTNISGSVGAQSAGLSLSSAEQLELIRLRAENEIMRGQITWMQNTIDKLLDKLDK